jgi:hypothetical protein
MPSTATTHHFTLLEAIMRISPLFGTVASMSFLLFRLVFPLTCDCNVNSCNTELATSCENPPDCHLTASFSYTHTQCREVCGTGTTMSRREVNSMSFQRIL